MRRWLNKTRYMALSVLLAFFSLALVAPLGRPDAEVAGAYAELAEDGTQVAASDVGVLGLASPLELALLGHVNVDRAAHGLHALDLEPAILDIARTRAEAQLGNERLTHYDSEGELVFLDLLINASVSFSLAGENLARAGSVDESTVERIEQALMNSPTHRQNILEPSFTRLAVGAATDESGRVAFAQIFLAAP
jgi:uncharacterized protein YkwD